MTVLWFYGSDSNGWAYDNRFERFKRFASPEVRHEAVVVGRDTEAVKEAKLRQADVIMCPTVRMARRWGITDYLHKTIIRVDGARPFQGVV